MAKALIRLAYRQVIDASSTGEMEKRIFHDSYAEYLMKIQAYNPDNKFNRFTEIVAHDGRANSLHYKTSFAVLHHIGKLGNKIPGLQDAVGRISIPFITPEFKVLESSATDKNLHKVAVIYISETMTLIDHFGSYMLLSMGDQSTAIVDETMETFLLGMQNNLSIINYRQLTTEMPLALRRMSTS